MTSKSIPTEGKYVLTKTGRIRQEKDLLKWAKWMETPKRRIAYTDFPKHYVSTIFSGLNFGLDSKKPILFETMTFQKRITRPKPFKDLKSGITIPQQAFQKSLDNLCERYYTQKEALEGHKRICGEVKKLEKKDQEKTKKKSPSNPASRDNNANPIDIDELSQK